MGVHPLHIVSINLGAKLGKYVSAKLSRVLNDEEGKRLILCLGQPAKDATGGLLESQRGGTPSKNGDKLIKIL